MREAYKFSIESELFTLVPTYMRVVVLADRTGPGQEKVADSLLASGIATCRERIKDAGEVTELSEIKAWRSAFRAIGFDPTRTRPAVEALMRRAARGSPLGLGHPLIDIGTGLSLMHGVPVGMHTLDGMVEPLVLGRASGKEEFVPFNGITENPESGEWVYRSGNRVLTRKWVWKQGAFGAITETNVKLAINLDLIGAKNEATIIKGLGNCLLGAGFEIATMLRLDSSVPSAKAK